MSLKENIEKNPYIYLFGVGLACLTAGWGGAWGVDAYTDAQDQRLTAAAHSIVKEAIEKSGESMRRDFDAQKEALRHDLKTEIDALTKTVAEQKLALEKLVAERQEAEKQVEQMVPAMGFNDSAEPYDLAEGNPIPSDVMNIHPNAAKSWSYPGPHKTMKKLPNLKSQKNRN